MKIFSGTSNKPLAEKIAGSLKQELGKNEIFVFSDGERRIRLIDSVVNEDVVIVQSTNTPVDSNYMELFFLIDSAKRSGAKSITVVVPYMGYERQDHVFRTGEDVSVEAIIKMLEALRIDKFISFDFHSVRIPELFSIPATHLSALTLFETKIKDLENYVLVSPDMGGIRRIRLLSEMLHNANFATIAKNRDLSTGDVSSTEIEGYVAGKNAVIVDDMISTGRTVREAVRLLRKNGAEKIYVFATHAVLSGAALSNLEKMNVEKIYLTDTINFEIKNSKKTEVLSVADLIARNL